MTALPARSSWSRFVVPSTTSALQLGTDTIHPSQRRPVVAIDCYPLSERADIRPRGGGLIAEPTERLGLHETGVLRPTRSAPHLSSMRRVSAVAAFGGVSMSRLLVGMITKIV